MQVQQLSRRCLLLRQVVEKNEIRHYKRAGIACSVDRRFCKERNGLVKDLLIEHLEFGLVFQEEKESVETLLQHLTPPLALFASVEEHND